MLGLEKIAEWWDGYHDETEDILQDWVNNSNSDFEVNTKAGFATALSTAMVLGAGMVDILRIGEGVKAGGWGYAQDGLRLLTFAGPLLKIGRLGFARWTFNPRGPFCATVATVKALRHTGPRPVISLAGALKNPDGAFPKLIVETVPFLRALGVRLKEIPKWDLSGLNRLVQSNPKAVILFGVRWKRLSGETVAHRLYAYRDLFGRLKIADRTGKIVSSLKELEVYYKGISSGVSNGSAAVIYNSAIVEGTTLASILAFEVNITLSKERGEKKVIVSPVEDQ